MVLVFSAESTNGALTGSCIWRPHFSLDRNFRPGVCFGPGPNVAARSRGHDNFGFVFESKRSVSVALEAKIVEVRCAQNRYGSYSCLFAYVTVCLSACLQSWSGEHGLRLDLALQGLVSFKVTEARTCISGDMLAERQAVTHVNRQE